MDGILKRELDAIARDNVAGAAELTGRAVAGILGWIQRTPRIRTADLLTLARSLLRGHGTLMAPLYRLANEVLWAADANEPKSALTKTCRQFEQIVQSGNIRIAKQFARAVRRSRKPVTILTYSYSSTVVRSVIQARSRIRQVFCAESRPQFEGRKTALALAKASFRVTLVPDTVALMLLNPHETPFNGEPQVLVGADQIREKEIINKAGTELFLSRANEYCAPAWVLADTTKLVPSRAPHLAGALCRNPLIGDSWRALWPDLPKNISVFDQILGPSTLFPSTRVLTENGILTALQAAREIQKIRISPRMKRLFD